MLFCLLVWQCLNVETLRSEKAAGGTVGGGEGGGGGGGGEGGAVGGGEARAQTAVAAVACDGWYKARWSTGP